MRRPALLCIIVGCSFDGGSAPDAGASLPDARDHSTNDAGVERDPILLEVGSGEDSFESLVDGQVVELEYGIQGGFHLWAAARVSDATVGGITLIVELEDRAGPIFRQRHLRQIPTIPFDLVGMRALIEPDMVDTSSVALIVTAIGEDGRRGEDRRVIAVRGER